MHYRAMKSFSTEILAFHLLAGMLIGGCAPVISISPTPSHSPPIATPTETQAPFGVTVPPPQAIHIYQVHMMDESSGWAWALNQTDEGLLLHSSDGGRTWMTVTPQGNISPGAGPYTAYLFNAQMAWFILPDTRLVRTSDGGQTWEIINHSIKGELVWPTLDWYHLRFADAKHGWLETGLAAAG